MDIAIIESPYASALTIIKGTGATIQASSRAAKMNEDKDHKVTNMKENWVKRRPNMAPVKEEKVEAPKVDNVTLIQKLELEPIEHRKKAMVGGFRKLKVNDLVRSKTLSFYASVSKTPLPEELVVDKKVADAKEPVIANSGPSINELSPTGEVNQKARYVDTPSNQNDVINTPARFAAPQPDKGHSEPLQPREEKVNPIPSRSNRKINEYASLVDNHQPAGIEVGQGERVLNKIASLNHGSSNATSNALEDALLEFNKSEADKKASIDNLRRLEEEVESMQKALEKQRASQIANLKAKTEANKEETLEYTMHSEDLKQKLAELRNQLVNGDTPLN